MDLLSYLRRIAPCVPSFISTPSLALVTSCDISAIPLPSESYSKPDDACLDGSLGSFVDADGWNFLHAAVQRGDGVYFSRIVY